VSTRWKTRRREPGADEDIDGPILEALRDAGHQVWYLAEMDPGTPDEEVLELAEQSGALLLTADKDFGELVFRQRRKTRGVVLTRLAGVGPRGKAALVADVVEKHGSEFGDAFTVVTPSTVRIRGRT